VNKTTAILLAAGKSERIGKDLPKPFLLLKEKPIYKYSLDILLEDSRIDEILFVLPQSQIATITQKFENKTFDKTLRLIAGGASRFESVYLAVQELDEETTHVIIHDAARPFLVKNQIKKLVKNLSTCKAISFAMESTDTLVFSPTGTTAAAYPDRNNYKRIQTPQAFEAKLLKKAFDMAYKNEKTDFTDESSLVHFFDLAEVLLLPGNPENIKITYPEDLRYAEFLLNEEKYTK
jgi:2-C-methyl-D-erythritol 4-phosphate cytidylyltransferase